jgi:hypothetical protein
MFKNPVRDEDLLKPYQELSIEKSMALETEPLSLKVEIIKEESVQKKEEE